MAERPDGKKQFSILLDEEDYAEVERIARAKRSNISQVAREFIVAGVERERRVQELVAAV